MNELISDKFYVLWNLSLSNKVFTNKAIIVIQGCIQKSQDNAHNTQVACSSQVSLLGVLQWCLVSECAEWCGWMWKRLIVARVFMCILHQPSAIF